ncbi:MAG TPA: hypothetical protein VHQ90_24370 [Thermoanaerobaculia bacterium]|nr:hypothetical protein [Thermoanaerobaculia bacterium]
MAWQAAPERAATAVTHDIPTIHHFLKNGKIEALRQILRYDEKGQV